MKSGFKIKKDAINAGIQTLNDYNNSGQTFTPTEISISDYLDYWFDNYCKMNLNYNTQLAYGKIIEKHLKSQFGFYRLKALTTAALQEYVNKLKLQGLAKSSVVGILSDIVNIIFFGNRRTGLSSVSASFFPQSTRVLPLLPVQ